MWSTISISLVTSLFPFCLLRYLPTPILAHVFFSLSGIHCVFPPSSTNSLIKNLYIFQISNSGVISRYSLMSLAGQNISQHCRVLGIIQITTHTLLGFVAFTLCPLQISWALLCIASFSVVFCLRDSIPFLLFRLWTPSLQIYKTSILCLGYHSLCCIPESACRQTSGEIWWLTLFASLCLGVTALCWLLSNVWQKFSCYFCLVFSLLTTEGQLWPHYSLKPDTSFLWSWGHMKANYLRKMNIILISSHYFWHY